MTYSRSGDRITVEFSIDEYKELLACLGLALLDAERFHGKDGAIARDVGRFIEALNANNPDYDIFLKS